MKTIVKFFAFAAVLMGLGCMACKFDTDEPDPTITYTAAADGSGEAASTAITFTFSKALEGLNAQDITVINDTGEAAKSELSGSGTSWSLGITVQIAGNVKVRISKDGIEAGEKTVRVFKEGEEARDIACTVAADGSATAASTKITFVFDAAVTGLNAQDITLAGGTGAAARGELSGSGTSWSLAITVQTAGSVKVRISKEGIEAGEKTVMVYTAPAFTKPIDLYLPEGLTREEWTGQGTAAEGWVLSVEEQSTVYVAAYKDAAQTITVSGEDQALVSPASYMDDRIAWEDFAVFVVKTGDLVFDGGTRTFTLNVQEEGGALPRSVSVTLKVNTNHTGAAVFKLQERDNEGVEYLERVGGNFSAFLEAFKWVENNAESDTEYTLRVEKDETRLPHLTVGLNSKNGADNVSLRLRGSAGGPWILEPEDVHFTSFTQIEHVDENDLGDATGFLDIGHMVGIQPARTFILGSNIIIKSGLIPGTPTGSAVIFINVWFNATLVLEPGSEITGHRVTRGNGFIRIGCHNPNPDKDPTRHGKLRILGGAITNCMIQEDRGLLSFTGDPSYVSDGAFYLAPGNVFRLSGNTGATGGDQVNAVAFGITTLYPITEEYLTNGVSMPPVPTE